MKKSIFTLLLLLVIFINSIAQNKTIIAECSPVTTSAGTVNMGVHNFIIGTINNSTNGGTDSYQDYSSSDSTDLTEGINYPISITTGSSYSEDVYLWVDLNNDGHFDNTTELLFTSLNVLQNHTGNILIPTTAVKNTPIRLRVMSDYYNNNITGPCYSPEYGQVEDYSVTILDNTNPPVADFAANVEAVNLGETIDFTDLSENIPDSWTWYFEGGIPATSNQQNPTVSYNTLGVYEVKLIASNSYGTDSIVKTNYINVVNSYNMCSGTISTTSSSGLLYDSGGATGNFSYNENCSFLISPGCATSIDFTVNFEYMPSSYDRLKVYDGADLSGTLLYDSYTSLAPITVTATTGQAYVTFYSNSSSNYSGFEASWTSVIPVGDTTIANFSIGDTNPPLDVDVQFTDLSSNSPVGWLWDFGDGSFSNEMNPSHAFSTTGLQTVTLLTDNCFSTDTISKTLMIQDAPIISVNPDTLVVDIVNCNDSLMVPITIYNTGLGDLQYEVNGNSSSGEVELLALTYGVDLYTEYSNTISAINQYFTDYNLTEINTTDPGTLQSALDGKDVLLIAEQENGSPTVFSGFSAVLQSFVNNGGTVIFCGTSSSGCVFNTNLFSGSYLSYINSGTLNVLDTSHPITDQLPSTISSVSATFYYNITNTDAVRLVEYNNYDIVTYREIGLGKAIYIGFDYYNYNAETNQIIANAVKWGGYGSLSPWISLSNYSDTIPVGDSTIVNVTFNASNLNSGTYTSDIQINSNDPLNPQIAVSCTMNVIGAPEIALSQNSLDLGSAMTSTSVTDTLILYNNACDTLEISNFVTSNAVWTVNAGSMNILPYSQDTLIIQFSPTAVGAYNDTLYVFNNDVDTIVLLNGTGTGAPVISTNPTNFDVYLSACSDSITIPLAINNSGLTDLIFEIQGLGDSFVDSSIVYYTYDGQNTIHNFYNCPNSDSLFIEVTLNGDYTNASTEYAILYIDGTNMGIVNTSSVSDGTDYIRLYSLGGTQVENWLSDGEINIILDNTSGVDTGYGQQLNKVKLYTNGTGWVTVNPDTGTTAINDSTIIDVTFNSSLMSGGTYTGEIKISSNDPIIPTLQVPCTLHVDFNPCANFSHSIYGCSGVVNFSDESVNSPISWAWNFGDGTTSSIQNPSHQYSSVGTFTTQLVVCNSSGCDTISYDVIIDNIGGPVSASCTPGSNYTYTSYDLTRFNLGTIDNFSTGSTSGYQDYTCTESATLTQGVSYPVVIQTGSSYTQNVRVWIDYNNDGNFGASELVFDTLNSYSPHNGIIEIPFNTDLNTPLRARVACDRTSYASPEPCVNVAYGEFEDYTIVIEPNTNPPTANFTSNILDDCQGVISFTDNSQNLPTSWHWDFGDGTVSYYQNPYHTYTTAGTYTVTLTASNSFGANSYSETVTVNSLNPDILYSGQLNAGAPIMFSTSTVDVVSWQWEFGDGYQSTTQSPGHVFAATGTYTVCLTVVAANGCTDIYCETIIIGSASACAANFTSTPEFGTNNVSFTDISGSTNITSWLWNFGDGYQSTTQNPGYTYTDIGTYVVCLTISTSAGCENTYCETITISSTSACTANFTNTLEFGTNNVSFTDISDATDIVSWLWVFGDGYQSTTQNPAHTYADGTYDVCLTINTAEGCEDTYCETITITSTSACTANFTHDYVSGNNVSFTDISDATDVVSWLWNFGDGYQSTTQNPGYTYDTDGTYDVCLTINTAEGCEDTYCETITISSTSACTANFTHDYVSGNNVSFTDISETTNIVSWLWVFGDGYQSTTQTPGHTYDVDGTYNVCLTINTAEGCEDTYCETITISSTSTCTSNFTHSYLSDNNISFTDVSEATDIVSWLWNFGDGYQSMLQNPEHVYDADGEYVACLTINTADGCGDTYCETITINSITTCTSNFTHANVLGGKDISFTDISEAANIVSWLWTFGDGYQSMTQNPEYEYAEAGTYVACLTINTESDCIDTYCTQVVIEDSLYNSLEDNSSITDINSTTVLYPNPTTDILNIDINLDIKSDLYIKILTVTGQLVSAKEYSGNSGDNTITLSTELLTDGIYLLQIGMNNGGVIHKKFIKH